MDEPLTAEEVWDIVGMRDSALKVCDRLANGSGYEDGALFMAMDAVVRSCDHALVVADVYFGSELALDALARPLPEVEEDE